MIFNELIENVEQMKVKKSKKVILEVSLDLKIYFIYIVYLYRMKKNPSYFLLSFFARKIKTLYSRYLVIADTFYGTAGVHYRQV